MRPAPHLRTAAGPDPTIGPDRIVAPDDAGDVVLGFYPDVAPKTVAHVLALARVGAFDGMDFFRVVPGFVEQLDAERTHDAAAGRAAQPLAARPCPWRPAPGSTTSAGCSRWPTTTASPTAVVRASPSCSAPANARREVHDLRRRGEGMDVVDEIAAVPLSGSRPVVPVVVQHAVVTDAAGLAAMHAARGPIPIGGTAASADISTWPRLLLSTSMGDVLVILSPRDAPAHLALIEQLVRSGAYQGASLGRADPGQYVQWFPANPVTATSTLPVETGTVGNVAGALTIDSRDTEATPALTFLLADDHALDGHLHPGRVGDRRVGRAHRAVAPAHRRRPPPAPGRHDRQGDHRDRRAPWWWCTGWRRRRRATGRGRPGVRSASSSPPPRSVS